MASKNVKVKALVNIQYKKEIYKVDSTIIMKETEYEKLKGKGIAELVEEEQEENNPTEE